MRRCLVLAGTTIFAAFLVIVGTTTAAGSSALLTYALDLGGNAESGGLCLARPDGTRRRQLTSGSEDRSPSWSPDGRLVAFSRRLAGEPTSRIVVADARGRVVRQFGSGALNTDPAWSPDGRRIAYSAGEGASSRIVVSTTLGQVIATLPAHGAFASSPAWSPGSKRIAYVERLDTDAEGQAGPSRIVVVAADGTGRRVLVAGAGDPAWSPDGSVIAYVAYATRWPESGDIAVASVNGGNRHRLTSTRTPEAGPAWSPDGELLAFARGSERESVIVVAGRDGSGERVVVRSPAYGAVDPAWRPRAALTSAPRRDCA